MHGAGDQYPVIRESRPLPSPSGSRWIEEVWHHQSAILRAIAMCLRFNLTGVPHLSSKTLRASGVYTSGALYSIAFYLMLDSAMWSFHKNDSSLHIGFADWLPLMLSSLGMAVINIVEKNRLNGGAAFGSEYGVANETWQAKIVLFLGFAFLSGGLAGSVVIFVLRYILHHHGWPVLAMGIQNIGSSFCIMISCLTLWIAQNVEDDYSYSLQL